MSQVLRRRNPSPEVVLQAVLAAQGGAEFQPIPDPPATASHL